jgi:chemotaxis methyl-accepting protein methylase
MNSTIKRDLSFICFEGKSSPSRRRPAMRATPAAEAPTPASVSEERLDEFLAWIMNRSGLDASAYRPQPLNRRLQACLRALKVHSICAARELLERKPVLVARVVSSLLIGVTEFFREPNVFDFLRTQILPSMATINRRLRIWSAACSNGAELYSVAILLAEAGLLERTDLLGTDCRGDAIADAKLGLYDVSLMKLVQRPARDAYFERAGQGWKPVEALRRHAQWRIADLLDGVEDGPWDIILWRNSAIYLRRRPAEAIWRRLAETLSPGGMLITGKAEQPPQDTRLTRVVRCIYSKNVDGECFR